VNILAYNLPGHKEIGCLGEEKKKKKKKNPTIKEEVIF
jgi:hypothetical protein